MNEPPYFLTDSLEEVTEITKEELELSNLVFDYGYVEEINVKLQKKNNVAPSTKYPLIWLVTPFPILKGISFNIYGKARLRIFFINTSAKLLYSPERYDKNYKGVLLNIKEAFLRNLNQHESIESVPYIPLWSYEETFRPYWGENQKSVFDDMVDVLEISSLEIIINNNLNC